MTKCECFIRETGQFRKKLKRSSCSCFGLPSNDTRDLVLACGWEPGLHNALWRAGASQLFQSEAATLLLGSSSGDDLHWQGFAVKPKRLLAEWRNMVSVDAVLISGKNCPWGFLSLWRGLEGTSSIIRLRVEREFLCVCHRTINLDEMH